MGISKLIKEGYDLLSLETFFTSGEEESRAWTVKKNTLAPQAAGVIHSDFEKNFIRAEAVDTKDFINSVMKLQGTFDLPVKKLLPSSAINPHQRK